MGCRLEPIDPATLAAEVTEGFRQTPAALGYDIQLRIEPGLTGVAADKEALSRVSRTRSIRRKNLNRAASGHSVFRVWCAKRLGVRRVAAALLRCKAVPRHCTPRPSADSRSSKTQYLGTFYMYETSAPELVLWSQTFYGATLLSKRKEDSDTKFIRAQNS